MEEKGQQMFKAKVCGSVQEVIFPDFPDDDNTVTNTVTKSRRVSFGTNFIKEFIVGSAVSAQCVSEYEQAFSSSDSSNPNSSHSAVESDILDPSAPFIPECSKIHSAVPPVFKPPDLNPVEPKPAKFSRTICFNADSPTADMEFTEGCITLAKSILDKKNKEMTVIIQAKSKEPKEEERSKKEDVTKFFDGSQLEMSMTRCLKSKENKREERRFESEKTKIFNKFDDEMSITRCDKVFKMRQSKIPGDSDFMTEDSKENRMPLDLIMRHLDGDDSDSDLFNPEKSFSDVLNARSFDLSNESEKLNLNESMDISNNFNQIVLETSRERLSFNGKSQERVFTGVDSSDEFDVQLFKSQAQDGKVHMTPMQNPDLVADVDMSMEIENQENLDKRNITNLLNPKEAHLEKSVEEMEIDTNQENINQSMSGKFLQPVGEQVEKVASCRENSIIHNICEVTSSSGPPEEMEQAQALAVTMDVDESLPLVSQGKVISETAEEEPLLQLSQSVTDSEEIATEEPQPSVLQSEANPTTVDESLPPVSQCGTDIATAMNESLPKESQNEAVSATPAGEFLIQVSETDKMSAIDESLPPQVSENVTVSTTAANEPQLQALKIQTISTTSTAGYESVPQISENETGSETTPAGESLPQASQGALIPAPTTNELVSEVVQSEASSTTTTNECAPQVAQCGTTLATHADKSLLQVSGNEAIPATDADESLPQISQDAMGSAATITNESLPQASQCASVLATTTATPDDSAVEAPTDQSFPQIPQTETMEALPDTEDHSSQMEQIQNIQQVDSLDQTQTEPHLVDVKVVENLEDQSKESNCMWTLRDVRYPQRKTLGFLSCNCTLLKSSAIIKFGLKKSKENCIASCSSITSSSVYLQEETTPVHPEYNLVLGFGFKKLEEYFNEGKEKISTVRHIPYFLDEINAFMRKLNSYLQQIYEILISYPGSSLKDVILSFRLFSYPIFFSSTVSINLSNLYRLSKSSLSFKHDIGKVDEKRIRIIFQDCLKHKNCLCEFIIRSNKYLFDVERGTGFVSKRAHIRLLPEELRL